MFRPSDFSIEIESLVDTFIIRWGVSHDVASKLVNCSPEVQWQVITLKALRKVHNPNGFVMSRITKAIRTFHDSPVRSSAPVTLVEARRLDRVKVPESPVLLTEPPSISTHPSPWADWQEESEVEKGAAKKPTEKKMPGKNGKGTSPEAVPWKESLHPSKARNRSRSPVARKRSQRVRPAGQVPAEMHIPIMALEQLLLEPLEGDVPAGDVNGYLVRPLIIPLIPSGLSQNWICMESKLTIYPGDIVYGMRSEEGWIRTVSIPAQRCLA